MRIKELDGIRGIAIFLVIIWHYIACQFSSQGYWFKFLSLTWSGVDLFFVLSGFLIVGILLDFKGSSSYFTTFYLRRALRILPLYALMLFLFILLPNYISNDWLFSNSLPHWSYFTFTQNFFVPKHGFGANWLGITWSLAVEEQFYLFLPLLVWGTSRKRLTYIFLILICMAPIFRILFKDLGGYVLPFARADSILMGGLLAIAYRTPKLKKILEENYAFLTNVFFISLLATGILSFKAYRIGDFFLHLWLAGLYCLLILVCTLRTGKMLDILVSNHFFVWLGLRSYAIYLFHQPISSLIHQYLNHKTLPSFSNLQEFYATVLALIITFILAEISFRFFESIFLSYGKKFKYETKLLPH